MIILTLIFVASLPIDKWLRITFLKSLPLAFCVVTSFFSVLLAFFSSFDLVTPLIIRVLVLCLILWGAIYIRNGHSIAFTNPWQNWPACSSIEKKIIALLGIVMSVVAFNALCFPPSNWDSMAYHMSRVANWFQNRSVFPYVTNDQRQNQMTPGAEYLILIEQLFWESDRWANSIQLNAFLIIGFGLWGWFINWGVSRLNSLAIISVFLAAPMVVLQAQTTQNDLVASVPTVVIVVAVVDHFLRNIFPYRANCTRYLVCAVPIAMGTGYLIKPTSILICTPFLLAIAPAYFLTIVRDFRSFISSLGSVFFGVLATISEITHKWLKYGHINAENLVTLRLSSPMEQLFNSIRHIVDHLPAAVSLPVVSFVGKIFEVDLNILTRLDLVFSIRSTEDYVGNPLQLFVTIIFLGPLIVRLRDKRLYIIGLSLLSSWLLFHAIVKNQTWTSRLQTPWFVATSIVWGATISQSLILFQRTLVKRIGCAVVFTSLAMTFYIQGSVTGQRLFQSDLTIPTDEPKRFKAYYLRRSLIKFDFENLKRLIGECKIVYIKSRRNQYDYPLAWMAIKSGKRVQYITDEPNENYNECVFLPSFSRGG